MLLFLNPTIEVATFHRSGWCMLGMFLLVAFTCLRLGCQGFFLVHVMECMCAQTRPQLILIVCA